jgi:hypothetical protein
VGVGVDNGLELRRVDHVAQVGETVGSTTLDDVDHSCWAILPVAVPSPTATCIGSGVVSRVVGGMVLVIGQGEVATAAHRCVSMD